MVIRKIFPLCRRVFVINDNVTLRKMLVGWPIFDVNRSMFEEIRKLSFGLEIFILFDFGLTYKDHNMLADKLVWELSSYDTRNEEYYFFLNELEGSWKELLKKEKKKCS